MIYFHASRGYTFTMNSFVHSWDKPLAEKVISVPYGDLDFREPIPAGLHIFTDFERLRRPETAYVQALHDRMLQHPDSYSVLNSPGRWSGRLGLNQALSVAGHNDYRAFRIGDVGPDLKFPAFVRWENEHSGSLGQPVMSHESIVERANQHATGRLRLQRHKLLVVEKLDARSEDGLFRKYSVLKVGDRLLPRHVLFSDDWVTKMTDIAEPWTNQEECDYIENFSDEKAVNEAFRLAGLDYGRIDYGFVDGRLQVWEINTNPVVVQRREKVKPARMQSQEMSARSILGWLHELADTAPSGPAVNLFGRVEAIRWHSQIRATHAYDKRRK